MPDSPLPTSLPEQVVRFRLRTMLLATTAAAVVAAIAAPFYRWQSPEAQHALQIYWTCFGFAAGAGVYFTWRGSWRLPSKAGAIECVLWTSGRAGPSFMSRPAVMAILLTFWLGFIALQSHVIAARTPRDPSPWSAAYHGLLHGMMISGFLMIFVPRPFYLCAHGVPIGPQVIPWHYIRSAEWKATDRTVLRLHRLDGDLFVSVPDYLRDGVEKLVAERTQFVGETVHLAPGQ